MAENSTRTSAAPWWPRRLYDRFLHWLWHGPLTRDLRPARPPSQLSQALALLGDLCRAARSRTAFPGRLGSGTRQTPNPSQHGGWRYRQGRV